MAGDLVARISMSRFWGARVKTAFALLPEGAEVISGRRSSAWRFVALIAVCGTLATSGCTTTETESLGEGYLLRWRTTHGLAHQLTQRDLLCIGPIGIPWRVYRNIDVFERAPAGGRAFLTIGNRWGREESRLLLLDKSCLSTFEVTRGRFLELSWDPQGRRFVYMESFGPLMLFDGDSKRSKEIASPEFLFKSWSPRGTSIALSDNTGVHDENSLYRLEVEATEREEVARKEGFWTEDDFEWHWENGRERIEVR